MPFTGSPFGSVGGSGGGAGSDTTAIHDNTAGEINAIAEKVNLVGNDEFILEDSEAAKAKKKVKYSNITGGFSDSTAVHTDGGGEIDGVAEKVAPVSTDVVLIEDSEDSSLPKKKVQLGNIPSSALENIVEDITPEFGGNVGMNNKYFLLFDKDDENLLGGDHAGLPFVAEATIDANATGFGAALYLKANGNYAEADANSNTTAPCTALALESGTGAGKKVLLFGAIRDDSWNWTVGPGDAGLIFLDVTTGAMTQTDPDDISTISIVQVLGYALTSDVMFFNPQLTIIQL